MSLSMSPPLSLYIHIPWCIRKCPYCDFNSHQVKADIPEAEYVSALVRDLEQTLPLLKEREIISIFIGGGTPSLLSGQAVGQLLKEIRSRLVCPTDLEITLESNPGTLKSENLEAYREAGVNRLSIGVQSFRELQLQALGRIHSGAEASRGYAMARAAGFDNINLDLMFGLPEDTADGSLEDLSTAIALQPEHLSWYQLTVEPNTAFYRCPPVLPGDDDLWEMQQAGQLLLEQQGYYQYEISAYARNQNTCRHNRNYWEFGDYIGIGAGAHGKLTDITVQQVCRTAKVRQPQSYMQAAGGSEAISSQHVLGENELVVEFMMNALRLKGGFSLALFEARTGLPTLVLEKVSQEAQARGFLELRDGWVRPTELGYRYLNELIYLFYNDEE